jgi:hypothetical protein
MICRRLSLDMTSEHIEYAGKSTADVYNEHTAALHILSRLMLAPGFIGRL